MSVIVIDEFTINGGFWLPGDTLPWVSFDVNNTGAVSTGVQGSFQLYLSKDSTITTDDHALMFSPDAETSILNLGPGSRDGISTSAVLPDYGDALGGSNGAFIPGKWYIGVIASFAGNINETDITSSAIEFAPDLDDQDRFITRDHYFGEILHPVGLGDDPVADGYSVEQGFSSGTVFTKGHLGTDWNRPGNIDNGDNVYSIFDAGRVVYADEGLSGTVDDSGTNYGYGGVAVVEYTLQAGDFAGLTTDLDFTVLYAHLKDIPAGLQGQIVSNDDPLGTIGHNYNWLSTGPHLHMAIMEGHGIGQQATFVYSTYPNNVKAKIQSLLGSASEGTAFSSPSGSSLDVSFIRSSAALASEITTENLVTFFDPEAFVEFFQSTNSGGGGISGPIETNAQYGNEFANILSASAADTWLQGKAGNDTLTGDDGHDTVLGNGGEDMLIGGRGLDLLFGGDQNDTLTGNGGNDTLDGGIGADSMVGGYGSDVYRVDALGDRVVEKKFSGIDTVEASVDYLMHLQNQHIETLLLIGPQDLTGGGNGRDNLIVGNAGNNALSGRYGDDTLIGGGGNDTLHGGSGPGDGDIFVFADGDGDDIILDFDAANGERIDLSDVKSIGGFWDLINNHLTEIDGNAVVTFGSDSITLDRISMSDVGYGQLYSQQDFIF